MLPADHDKVTQRMDAQEVRIITAIGKVEAEVKHVKDTVLDTALAVARLEERVSGKGGHSDRLSAVEGDVKDLHRADRITATIGAILGPAAAGFIAWFTGERR